MFIPYQFSWFNANLCSSRISPFACISIGRAARKQGLNELACHTLNSLPDNLNVEYSFLKLREKVMNMNAEVSLAEVNATNISSFDSRQKAELFRLKAKSLMEMGENPKANQAYGHAVQISPNYARAWVDWGLFCASLSPDSCNDSNAESQELENKRGLYLVQAMSCL